MSVVMHHLCDGVSLTAGLGSLSPSDLDLPLVAHYVELLHRVRHTCLPCCSPACWHVIVHACMLGPGTVSSISACLLWQVHEMPYCSGDSKLKNVTPNFASELSCCELESEVLTVHASCLCCTTLRLGCVVFVMGG